MRILKQNTSVNIMVLMTGLDHILGAAGLTLTITASKNGGAFASITPTVTERGSGWYNLAFTAAHTDTLGDLAVHITATGADPTDFACSVFTQTFNDIVAADNTGIAATGVKVDELHKIRGLNQTSPWTVTPTTEVAGNVALAVTGDGIASSTLTRQ